MFWDSSVAEPLLNEENCSIRMTGRQKCYLERSEKLNLKATIVFVISKWMKWLVEVSEASSYWIKPWSTSPDLFMTNFDRASLVNQAPPASTDRSTKSRLSSRSTWVSAKWPLQRICLPSIATKYTINAARHKGFLSLLTIPLNH